MLQQFTVEVTYLRCQFLPRDAMRKRGVCCRPVSVRLSVRLSRSCIVQYPDGWRYRQASFTLMQLHHSSFWPRATVPNSKGNPFRAARNTGGGKICDAMGISLVSHTFSDKNSLSVQRSYQSNAKLQTFSSDSDFPLERNHFVFTERRYK